MDPLVVLIDTLTAIGIIVMILANNDWSAAIRASLVFVTIGLIVQTTLSLHRLLEEPAGNLVWLWSFKNLGIFALFVSFVWKYGIRPKSDRDER